MNDISFENIEIRPDIFPSKWHYKNLNPEDVEWITGGINRASRLATKSRLNSSYWKKSSLDKLIESYSDAWNYGDQMIICVWDVHQKESEPPIGFISFDIAWHETSAKKISNLFLTINLIWVRPDKRGLGGISARHITSHLILYFESCKLYHPFVALKGLTVFYYADFDSFGGEKICKRASLPLCPCRQGVFNDVDLLRCQRQQLINAAVGPDR